MSEGVVLSVVVTVVGGGGALARCLSALEQQEAPPPMEVLLPFDASISQVGDLAGRFPTLRLLPLGVIPTRHPVKSAAGQHELFDRRRSAGLAAARGEFVAIVEDRGAPRPSWARTAVGLHRDVEAAAVGGAIEQHSGGVVSRALYYCDFGRYQLPFAAGERSYVSDVNVCYRRGSLEATRSIWQDEFHETTVHWALRRRGERLWASPDLVVDHYRDGVGLAQAMRERVAWGRLFGHTRAIEVGRAARLAYAFTTPVLPLLLLTRLVRQRVARRRGPGFVSAAPAILLLLVAWSVGEGLGYLTGTP